MSLGLTKPGLRSMDMTGKMHPITGLPLTPIGYLRDGTAVWPQIGAAPDPTDPDDPDFTGEGGDDDSDDDSEDDEDDEDDEPKGKKRPKKSTKDDEDDEEPKTRPERQAARYRVKLREAEAANRDLAARLKVLENKDKPADEIVAAELTEAKDRAAQLAEKNKSMTLELAFFKSNTIDWIDPADALRLVDLDDVDVDDSGTVDAKALRLALRDLAKRKPHLVKKSKAEPEDDDDDDDDEEPRSRRSAPKMNGRRSGQGKQPSRAELAKKFPVLNR